ncbi:MULTISPECIES: hormogonium polysaccharide biosynthesis protein HpsA [unclassified Microcoleus]|uniref:hormogonium polysaccharide biosynthesis protein HpsA n=1 Tax=unclassified Microcoleus TaxID=2642155 RepID=UPI0025ECD816|nr:MULTISPECIES: hormogonium polysaccharide biosynthesis protein HpsA [unclassified Microcoleus]
MFKSKLSKVIVSLLRRIAGVTRSGAKRLMRAMLQALMAMGRRAKLPVAGFVLPTVTMVLLVVILLTVAIVLRSFDRANLARNVRVNQQVLAAATPALDRAKAKIQFLLYEDPQRPTSTPSDAELYRIMSANTTTPVVSDLYKFADEERLILKYPVVNGTTLTAAANDPKKPPLERTGPGTQQESEAINTAWRYPVDTNNDGKFDTFTLYGIFFRNPPLRVEPNGEAVVVARSRKPLDARTPPMALGALDPACASAGAGDNVATLVGDSGWYKLDGKLRKSFFVYTVNVPIKDTEAAALGANYQAFTGTSSISALEYQQDQSRIPLSNNAVVYEDDLEISPGANLNLNGRILTNSNLLVTRTGTDDINFNLFQVSSRGSCFYDQENSRIQVAGNVVNGWSGNLNSRPVTVHLFKEKTGTVEPNAAPIITIDPTNQSAPTNNSLQVIYNGNAYSRRLNALVEGQILAHPDTPDLENDPLSVRRLVKPPAGSTQQPMSRRNALESYFRDTLRKVPFSEAPLGSNGGVVPGVAFNTYIQGSGESLRPIDAWVFPTTESAPNVGTASGAGRTELTLDLTQLASRNPEKIKSTESELNLGERVAVGNNLPALRWDGASKFLGASVPQKVGAPWTGGEPDRTRKSQVTKLADVGGTDRGNGFGELPGTGTPPFRDGFWEAVAAQTPRNPLDGTGGLRVITSGGVYDRTNSFLPPPRWNDGATDGTATSETGPPSVGVALTAANTYDDPATTTVEQYPVVWPDTMPMSPLGAGSQVYNNVTGPPWVDWTAGVTAQTTPAIASTTLLPGIVEETASARQYAKGDLRMRATAVYHYEFNGYNPDAISGTAQPNQTLYACVSSYYDPSNASTARNITSGRIGTDVSTDVSGQGVRAPSGLPELGSPRQQFIGSNNGITYTPDRGRTPPGLSRVGSDGVLTGGTDRALEIQASLVFPDGRFANGPLRTALLVDSNARTLAQKAAIDSTYCALDILAGTLAPDPTLIPHGGIQEVAFLNGREIKAIERDNPATPNNEAFTLSSPLTNPPLRVNYNQPLEEREPLEIRATQLNIRTLRQNRRQGSTTEWLLPNSGIIYASRDDALPDRSDRSSGTPATGVDEATSKRVSPSDSTLDPSRKPNGILLINGNYLFRGGTTPDDPPARVTSVTDVVKEKGLTLVSNLPVYIQGEFNTHGRRNTTPVGTPPAPFEEVEEFRTIVNPTDWSNFYQRASNDLNPNFACRAGDPRLPTCQGDFWRPANVLADSVTLISARYRFGFRNEGDFDLRNNAGAEAVLRRRQRGFFNNNFVTNGLSSGAFLTNGNLKPPATPVTDSTVLKDSTYVNAPTNNLFRSSYFNNFVTPVQRRGAFPEYVMEVCRKLPVSECGDNDWFVDPTGAGRTALDAAPNGIGTYVPPTVPGSPFQAGSTFDPPLPALQRFPRRVAFAKDPRNPTQLLTPANPQPLAIANGTNIAPVAPGTNAPAPIAGRDNSLWFAGISGTDPVFNNTTALYLVNAPAVGGVSSALDGSNTPLPVLPLLAGATPEPPVLPLLQGTQPLLMPFLQIRNVSATATNPAGGLTSRVTGWISQAENTTFNLLMATGDTPSVNINGAVGDQNGGLQNLPRFLENWNGGSFTTNIKGSFIQLNRSAFSTAPYQSILAATPPGSVAADNIKSVFGLSTAPSLLPPGSFANYNTPGAGLFPYFTPPNRNWGYDVGLLPQPPDLFTQKFTTPPSRSQPAEFFREVPRNDEWVKTLMCGIRDDGTVSGGTTPATSSRPTDCPA